MRGTCLRNSSSGREKVEFLKHVPLLLLTLTGGGGCAPMVVERPYEVDRVAWQQLRARWSPSSEAPSDFAVAAREPGSGRIVHLLPESLPGKVPGGNEPWIATRVVAKSDTPMAAMACLIVAAPAALLGGLVLASEDCGENVCGLHTLGGLLVSMAVVTGITGGTLLAIGHYERPEVITGEELNERTLLGPTPPVPPPPTMERTPLGVLPPAHSLTWTFEF